jgi:hypothetical protein
MTRFAKFLFVFALASVFDGALASVHSEFLRSPGASVTSTDSGSVAVTVDSLHRRAKKSSKSSNKDPSLSYSKLNKLSKPSASEDFLDFYVAPTTAPVALATSQPTFGGDFSFFLDQPDDDSSSEEESAVYAETNSKKKKSKSSKTAATDGSAKDGKSKTSKGGTKQSKKSQAKKKNSKSEKKKDEENQMSKSPKASEKNSKSKKSLRGVTSRPTGSPTSMPSANYVLSPTMSPISAPIDSPSQSPPGIMPNTSSSPVLLVEKNPSPSRAPSLSPTISIQSDVIDMEQDDNGDEDGDGEGLKVSQKALIGSMVVLAAFVFGGLAFLFKSTRGGNSA